ncbi:MAG TPA: hypothetical protein VNA04_09435 [Thermoanaerobaculia bacterium]|nr:hypothetical protein [Thermoanaerobaculia bacterium]
MWAAPPEPLTRRRKLIVAALTALVALTRLAALSRAPWEWDEILFASALREYDVVAHHPHPPGFPLFIGAAKVIALMGVSDFRSLQVVVVAGAMLLFPLTFALGRELHLGFGVSVGGALLTAFAPNVWYYGGTAFSDVPALAVVLAASVLLLRSIRDRRWYVAGCALLGVAIGFRPQIGVVGAVPWLMATWTLQSRRGHPLPAERGVGSGMRGIVAGVAAAIAIAGGSYAGAVLASSSIREYIDVVREQQEYVARVDSFRSRTRPSLPSLMRTFFKPTRGAGALDKLIPLLAALGAAASLIRRSPGVWVLLAMFGPLALFSWLMLDLNAASRYVIGYVAMFALLAAYGLETVLLPLALRREILTVGIAAALALWFAVSAWPALRQVRSDDPPLLRGIRVVAAGQGPVYVSPGVVPFAAYYLSGRPIIDVTKAPVEGSGFLLVDALSSEPCARNFIARRGRLADMARARYFEASVVPSGGCQ